MDRDVARETAAGWFVQIIGAEAVANDFGMAEMGLSEIIARVANGERDLRAFSTALFAVALALRLSPTVEGVENGDIDPPRLISVTRADLAWLFRQKDYQDDFLELALADVFTVETLGKPSGAGSDTNSAPAP